MREPQARRPAGLPILTYHAIGPERSVIATATSRFADTIAALIESGRRPIALDDWLAGGRPDEPEGFAVTFDDGLRSVLRVADVLARYRVPATVFLVTDRVGADNAWPGQPLGVPVEPTLDWSAIEALSRVGVRFASHGASHARLDRLNGPSLLRELRSSREAVEDRTGRPCRSLAYPYGWSSPTVRRLAATIYSSAWGTTLGNSNGSQDLFNLARIDAYYLRDPRVLDALIAGRLAGWLRRRRVLRSVRRRVVTLLNAGRDRS